MSRELVERAMRGDREAFAALAERSQRRLVGTAALILRDPVAAEDAAQDALVRAWRDLPSLRDPDRFDGWLYRLLVHSCHDHVRRARHELRADEWMVGRQTSVTDEAASLADRDELDRGLRRLNVNERTVLVLHYYLGLSDPEIGTVLGVPVGTVKSRTHRALSSLRAALAADARTTGLIEEIV